MDPETDLPLTADVTDREALREAVNRTESELGPVSLLVTVAGYYEMLPVSEMGSTSGAGCWRAPGQHLLLRYARERGGHIITISSGWPSPGDEDAHYAAAKGAIIGPARASPPRSQTGE